jgi:rSAM/selenodomain-associated transferase 1
LISIVRSQLHKFPRNAENTMKTVGIAIVCKTPQAGASKTRLSPPLTPSQCARLSGCFIRDVCDTIASLAAEADVTGVALYTPVASEDTLRQYVPSSFKLVPQVEGDFGDRLRMGAERILADGHDGAILVNSDSPTLPKEVLRLAVDAVRRTDNVVLGPAFDGGYTLIGLSKPHPRLFEDIPWSTENVYRLTVERAAEIGLPVENVPGWYDVDDAQSLSILRDELTGKDVSFLKGMKGAAAAATREFSNELDFFRHETNAEA